MKQISLAESGFERQPQAHALAAVSGRDGRGGAPAAARCAGEGGTAEAACTRRAATLLGKDHAAHSLHMQPWFALSDNPERAIRAAGELRRNPQQHAGTGANRQEKPQLITVRASVLVEAAGIEPASASPLQQDLHT